MSDISNSPDGGKTARGPRLVQPANPALQGKRILLGVTGGIAAYKAPAIVRELMRAGAEVQVVLSANARQFVTPTTLQAVSGHPVRDSLWDAEAEAAMGHIELARWADVLLIAPATANCMARLATGTADDLLSTLALATTAPVCIAPAMNHRMWGHAATQANLATLRARGVRVFGPETGDQACGEFGPGRMREPEDLAHDLSACFATQILSGKRVVITAGPTREAIDPVRYLSNHSSGKQGYAIAEAARDAGADVVLISGPVALAAPAGVTCVRVESARQMFDAVMAELPSANIVIGVAAVADYRVAEIAEKKIKREDTGDLGLALVANPDIIKTAAERARALSPRPLIVGFAAETDDVLDHARAKRLRKGLDVIVVNDVRDSTIGFAGDHNAVTIISDEGEVTLERQAKASVARELVRIIASINVRQLAPTHPTPARK